MSETLTAPRRSHNHEQSGKYSKFQIKGWVNFDATDKTLAEIAEGIEQGDGFLTLMEVQARMQTTVRSVHLTLAQIGKDARIAIDAPMSGADHYQWRVSHLDETVEPLGHELRVQPDPVQQLRCFIREFGPFVGGQHGGVTVRVGRIRGGQKQHRWTVNRCAFSAEAVDGARQRELGRAEAFDKVAKLLGLGYPGGPVIHAGPRARRYGS